MARSQPMAASRRRGFSYRGLVLALGGLLAVPAIGWSVLPRSWTWSSSDGNGPMRYTVGMSEFVHDVTERGNVESASNVEIASRVKSNNSGGTTLLEIVAEGTLIKPQDCIPQASVITHQLLRELEELKGPVKAAEAADSPEPTGEAVSPDGVSIPSVEEELKQAQAAAAALDPRRPKITAKDLLGKMVLVKLDASALENQRIQQQILCENSRAAVIQSLYAVKVAEIARSEYLEGVLSEKLRELDILKNEAEVELSQAQQYLDFSKKLERKGYITKQQLQDDQTRVIKAQNALDLANKKLQVLQDYTRAKMDNQLVADIMTSKAKLKADESSHLLDMEKLRFIEEQIGNCTIFSTSPGQVVYANEEDHHGDREIVIEPGTVIRENQVIIRLPDPTKMQVKAKINEARIALVEPGMEVTIKLDAFPDVPLNGVVKSVSDYPASSSWFRSDIKEYETIIQIRNPERSLGQGQTLRPGLTAEVKIRVEYIDNAIQVPVQAVIEHGQGFYAVFREGEGFRAHEVTLGPSNDKFVVIDRGLDVGQQVVLNAAAYREQLDLPEIPPEGNRNPARAEKPMQQPDRPNPSEMFKMADKNGDGKLQSAELPESLRSSLGEVDASGDGAVDLAEFTAAMRKIVPEQGGPGVDPGDAR